MALPDNVLSTAAVYAPFIGAAALPITPLRDFETGGIALNDASEGLQYQVWHARVVRNVDTGLDDIIVGAESVADTVVYSGTDITQLSIAFDRNMRLHYAWVESGDCKLHWYDSVAEEMTTTNFGSTFITPRLTHDDKRELQSAKSDIIFAYLKGGDLCYRQQRDRFDTERVLKADTGSAGLIKIGMNTANRLQFMLQVPR